MKDKDGKKPMGGDAGANGAGAAAGVEPGAVKQDAASAAGKAAEDPGAGKEDKKKPGAPTTQEGANAVQADEKNAGGKVPSDGANGAVTGDQNGAEGADVDSGKAAWKSEAGAGSDAEPGASAASTDGDTEPGAAAADAGGEDPEKEALRLELLAARSQLAAYGAGVAPEMIADAVTLATAEAQAAGDVSAESIAKAMEGVLKRHPEWKVGGGGGNEGAGSEESASGTNESGGGSSAGAAGVPNRIGGFKLGVDPAGVSAAGGESSEAKSTKRWNRFK